MSQHIMFSYQWNIQSLVSNMYLYLTKAQPLPIWMDKYGGMNECLSTSMAEGVENCCILVCFLTPNYQESFNCKKELTYAAQLHKPIIPCLIGSENKHEKWKPTQWLGLTIADMLYLDFTDLNETNFEDKCQELLHKINSVLDLKPLQSSEPLTMIEVETNEEDLLPKAASPLIIPEIIREGPQMSDRISDIIPKKYSTEGNSLIRLIDQSKEIQCNQDLYARNGRFMNSFVLSRFIFHNTSNEPIGILQLSAEYENINPDKSTQWISCECITNQEAQIMNIDPNRLILCSLTIKIEINGSPGVDHEHRCRAHHLLPQPLRLKISIEDTQMKQANLIVEQVNKPLLLPTLENVMDKLNLSQSNILGFVSADDCSIEVRYFVLVYYSNNTDPYIKFSFGCDLTGLRSPSWDKQYVKTLEKMAKKKKEFELIVHENIFDPFFHCVALFNHHFRLEAVQINIKTDTSRTTQTIPLPIEQIFN